MSKGKKPKELMFNDISITIHSEDYSDIGGAFCVGIEATIHSSKDMKRVIKRLQKCCDWLEQKEKYL